MNANNLPDLHDTLGNAASDLSNVLVIADNRGFRKGNPTAAAELLAEVAELRRASERLLASETVRDEAVIRLIGKYQHVTQLAVSLLNIGPHGNKAA